MVAAVDERHAHALHRRAGELAVLQRLLDALVDRRPEALRDDAADDLVDELVADVVVERLEHDVAVAELAAAAGLLLVAALRARLALDRLDVRHARLVQLHLDAEAALRPLDRDLDVHLAHARRAAPPRSAGRGGAAASDPPRRAAAAPARPCPRRPSSSASTAKLITGSGKPSAGGSRSCSASTSTSPVCTSFSFATAPMSPGAEAVGLLVLLALHQSSASRAAPSSGRGG